MKEQNEQKMRLIVDGAVSIYEGECLDIATILIKQDRTDLCEAYDAIGTALYWLWSGLEK